MEVGLRWGQSDNTMLRCTKDRRSGFGSCLFYDTKYDGNSVSVISSVIKSRNLEKLNLSVQGRAQKH